MELKLKRWRLIDTGTASAGWNMAVDEALLNGYEKESLPILRLYGWEASLSCGRFLKANGSLDTQRVQENGLALVRRMTGGGILVHGGDLSYSLIVPRSFIGSRSVKESYGFLCGFLIRLYEKLGLKAGFAQADSPRRSNVCLAANETYDIMIEGRKMGGNAQRHTKNNIFQHGSIPMSIDQEGLEPYFLEESGLSRAASLHRFGIAPSYEELSILLKEAFCETFRAELTQKSLSKAEKEEAQKLFRDKYANKEWNIDAKKT